MTDPDPKRTTDLSGIFPSEDERTTRIPRVDDTDAPTMRVPLRTAILTSRGRRATFTLDRLTPSGATLTGPLTFVVGDPVDLTFEVASERLTLAAEIVRVAIADLLTDEVAVRFVDLPPATLDRIASVTS